MSVNPERLQYLLERNAAKACSQDEMKELYASIASAMDEDLSPMLDIQFSKIDPAVVIRDVDWDFMLKQIMQHGAPVVELKRGSKVVKWRRIAVAASVLLVIGVGAYFFLSRKTKESTEIVNVPVPVDIKAPQTNRAVITLADGTTVYLDSTANGQLAMQDNVKLVKLADGQIVYEPAGRNPQSVSYNTLTNPRGSKVIDMTLADGSRVWLNAGSSVTYPVVFTGNERNVHITGEAYFEVASDVSKPFYVAKGDVRVQVLGTHFNVNAYEDEEDIRVTLYEGSVKVSRRAQFVMLKPGQQAVAGQSVLRINHSPDLEEVIAWKNGLFTFDKADIKAVMRQLARWYDLEVEYRSGTTGDLFGGSMQRDLPLSKVLEFLKKSEVRFEVEGKKVIVTP